MSSKEIDWEAMRKAAKDAARRVARLYTGIDPDDIEQEILTRVAENEATFKRIDYTPAGTFAILIKYGTKYANDERLSALHFSDRYHYSAKEIRTLCGQALFDRDAFMALVHAEDERFATDPEEVISRVVDLQAAYEKASEADREIIRKRFLGTGTLTAAEAKAALRAIDRLTVSINVGISRRNRPPVTERLSADDPMPPSLGSRKVMSNAAANNITRIQRDGH